MNAGILRDVIDLERDNEAQASGVSTKTPEVYASSVPAEAVCLSGREFFAAQQLQSGVNYRFRLRWRTDVKPQHRVIFESKRYEVRAVIPDLETRDSVTLMCEGRG